jgi:hypothetical protein
MTLSNEIRTERPDATIINTLLKKTLNETLGTVSLN